MTKTSPALETAASSASALNADADLRNLSAGYLNVGGARLLFSAARSAAAELVEIMEDGDSFEESLSAGRTPYVVRFEKRGRTVHLAVSGIGVDAPAAFSAYVRETGGLSRVTRA